MEISRAAFNRIPAYIKLLHEISPQKEYISATSIASMLGLGEVQVRKDLAALCGRGRPKVGYKTQELIASLTGYLSEQGGKTVIVGAGKLGSALLDYSGFAQYGLSVLAAFDIKVTEPIASGGGKPIYPLTVLPEFCRSRAVNIGIIAVPAASAQAAFDALYQSGVRAVCCFAPCTLCVPADATVQYENLALSLAHLKVRTGFCERQNQKINIHKEENNA